MKFSTLQFEGFYYAASLPMLYIGMDYTALRYHAWDSWIYIAVRSNAGRTVALP
jgi:hypothetical protein